MALAAYSETRRWATAIKAAVLSGEMPPWPVEDGVAFAGERLLSAREIDVLVDWATAGAPEKATETEAPPPPSPQGATPGPLHTFANARRVAVTRSVVASSTGAGAIRSAVLEFQIPKDTSVAGWRVEPRDAVDLREAWLEIVLPNASRQRVGVWTPALDSVSYGEAARVLPAEAKGNLVLRFEAGFQHRERAVVDTAELYFDEAEGVRARVVSLETRGGALEFETAGRLLALLPVRVERSQRTSPQGDEFSVRLEREGTAPVVLVRRGFLRPEWPIALRLVEPIALQPKDRLVVRDRLDGQSGEWVAEVIQSP